MRLIVWLWNPWDKYKLTKHNVWFMFLDYLKEKEWFSDFKFESKFKWDISLWIYNWEKTILLKPQTFMNLSWESIKKIVDYYKIDTSDIIITYDDMSMDFGKLRYRNKWSAWWHNGIKDIIRIFWEQFARIKIWIWYNQKYEVSDWVLSKFDEEEQIDLESEVFDQTILLLKEKF